MATEITIMTSPGGSQGSGDPGSGGTHQIYPPPPGTGFLKRLGIRVVAGLIFLAAIAAIVLVFAVALPIAIAILIAFGLFVLLIIAIALGRQALQRIGLIKPAPGVDFRVQRDQRENVRVRHETTARDVIDPPQ